MENEERASIARVYDFLESVAGGGVGKIWGEEKLIFGGLGGEVEPLGHELFESGADGGGFAAESDGGSVGLVGFRLF